MKKQMFGMLAFLACALLSQTAQAALSNVQFKKAQQDIASGSIVELNSNCRAVVLEDEVAHGEEYSVVIDKVKEQEHCINASRDALTQREIQGLVKTHYPRASRIQHRTLVRSMSTAATAHQKEASKTLLATQKEVYDVVKPFWMNAEMRKVREQTSVCLNMFKAEESASFSGASTLPLKFVNGQKCLIEQGAALKRIKDGPFNRPMSEDPHFYAGVLKTEVSRFLKGPH